MTMLRDRLDFVLSDRPADTVDQIEKAIQDAASAARVSTEQISVRGVSEIIFGLAAGGLDRGDLRQVMESLPLVSARLERHFGATPREMLARGVVSRNELIEALTG